MIFVLCDHVFWFLPIKDMWTQYEKEKNIEKQFELWESKFGKEVAI
jgi:hypothetical protein